MIDASRPMPLMLSFEGLDGAGKSTQIKRIADTLREQGYEVHIFRLNANDLFKRQCRLLNQLDLLDPIQAALMKAAELCGRLEFHIINLAAPRSIILWDKYVAGSLAADAARGVPNSYLQAIKRALPHPGLTVYLHIAPEEALRRKRLSGGPRMMESGVDQQLGISIRDTFELWKGGGISPEVMARSFVAFQTRLSAAYDRFLPALTIRLEATELPDVLSARILESVSCLPFGSEGNGGVSELPARR